MSRLTLIVAATKTNGIGLDNQMPWRLPKEMKYFAKITSFAPSGTQNAVIMGRNTWESIPPRFRPLVNRFNIVLTTQDSYKLLDSASAAVTAPSLSSALELMKTQKAPLPIHRLFVMGGGMVYKQALRLDSGAPESIVDRVLLTRILSPEFECDVFLDDFLSDPNVWTRAKHAELEEWAGFEIPEGQQEEKGVAYEFQMWTRQILES